MTKFVLFSALVGVCLLALYIHSSGHAPESDSLRSTSGQSLLSDVYPRKLLAPKREDLGDPVLASSFLSMFGDKGQGSGAIVCPNYDLLVQVYNLDQFALKERLYASRMPEQYRLAHGDPPNFPNLKAYDCVLIPEGYPMRLHPSGSIPVVSAEMPNGQVIEGVTLSTMIMGTLRLGEDQKKAPSERDDNQANETKATPAEASVEPSRAHPRSLMEDPSFLRESVVPQDLAPILHWSSQADGGVALVGAAGPCASLVPQNSDEVRLSLGKGVGGVFAEVNMSTAIQTAYDFCREAR